ncbi:hypothetical protein [Synechococcus sp. SYN20]|uniref:hypothetical protein n=1 Tax=Synechococcus sp. SYN20 TaxID=1050714 RepID=UPI001644ED23|nr:hypothetical protein [Synechococcus sp. SYN20]
MTPRPSGAIVGTDRSSNSSAPALTELMNTTTTHPIDHAIVAFLFLLEGIAWIINEAAGFHAPLTAETAEPELIDPRDVYAIEAPVHEPTITEMPDFAEYVEFMAPFDLAKLKVTELRKRARGLAKGVHLMRKEELLQVLA